MAKAQLVVIRYDSAEVDERRVLGNRRKQNEM